MVRTRAKKGTTAKQKDAASPKVKQEDQYWDVWLLDFENELEGRKHKLLLKMQEESDCLDRNLMLVLGQIPSEEANLPPGAISNRQKDSIDSIDSFDATLTSTIKSKGIVTSTAFKPMPPPEPKSTTRQSRAKTKHTRTRTSSLTDVSAIQPDLSSTRRLTRSSSQPRDNRSKFITDYQTPMNRPDRTLSAVTPKCDPYCPMPLKRYARQGEMAISLTGSPLMMTTSITEPNICLPLNNGTEVYSIQPTEGPCPVGIGASLDTQTRMKLQILRDNLSKILGEEH
ncbi:uncharacterized protein LOC113211146 [Frankliniella occidentalis]|uniref:Uncharacterized protein LOC113211146 n=1 Tax=Frankliniella occidentalis TaxID=133901 RepID=A0A6J1SWD2_FRAOC|nr:uncharacterized protein LOC113211146 [Frankliniella occidentalis]XP_026285229.1 uncharacterized protein LOC113211146 [Frankliniella occidentalis]